MKSQISVSGVQVELHVVVCEDVEVPSLRRLVASVKKQVVQWATVSIMLGDAIPNVHTETSFFSLVVRLIRLKRNKLSLIVNISNRATSCEKSAYQ